MKHTKTKLLALGFFLAIGCAKTNYMLVNQNWKIQYWKDTVLRKDTVCECPGTRTWFSDTVVSWNTGTPQGDYANLQNRPPCFIYEKWNNMWIRTYFEYKK